MAENNKAKKVAPLEQPIGNRISGAEVAGKAGPATSAATAPAAPSAVLAAMGVNVQAQQRPPAACSQCITVSFFFDGTGNNIDADTPTREHSNVARLYMAHAPDDKAKQVYRRYIPGIGTYFRDVGDEGGTVTGRGMGGMGQKRLDWAFKELATLLREAEARANNPSNRIVKVRIAAFGFSRGSALARAFVRDLQKSCEGSRGSFKVRRGVLGTSRMLVNGGYPIEVYFLGIFDTVASVGLPMSANNTLVKRRAGFNWRDIMGSPGAVSIDQEDLRILAFGEPGADPSPGPADGHGAWANGLRIPEIVGQCVHMVAAHENRNSFPVDSVLNGNRYPAGTIEMVYPGVHSDVGGGYRNGEGGKFDALALAPLREMLQRAVAAGVPAYSLDEMSATDRKRDFGQIDPELGRYRAFFPLWQAYMAQIPGQLPLGKAVLAHMGLYWRFRMSAAVLRTQGKGKQTAEQRTIQQNEQGFKKDRQVLNADAKTKRAAYRQAAAERYAAENARDAAANSPAFSNQTAMWKAQAAKAAEAEKQAYDTWRRAQARADTAANDSELLDSLHEYDEWLLEDAKLLYKWHKEEPGRRMRPHYKAIMDAYVEVVVNKRLLPENSDLYRFFSEYVHDSLAGFATDNTRTSDPRVLYIGGDTKEKYAAVQKERGETEVA